MDGTLVLGIVTLVLGLGLRYWINRRRFYRRSPAGGEGFSSYEKSVAIRLVERIGKLVALTLIILGLLFLWSYSREKKESEKAIPDTEVQSPQ
ncbi:molybdenum ABC transporter permease [Proteiniphilum saccharofermentans]|uniref:molybdenum ABC transporter permease n=1 Tax=Proteiniphilum saccharofermentans TaxID=1642647 RepID=UPI0028AD9D28|nr:molybdenum ABC transporter permease [Proteiniphilum saccharofermentans]